MFLVYTGSVSELVGTGCGCVSLNLEPCSLEWLEDVCIGGCRDKVERLQECSGQ